MRRLARNDDRPTRFVVPPNDARPLVAARHHASGETRSAARQRIDVPSRSSILLRGRIGAGARRLIDG